MIIDEPLRKSRYWDELRPRPDDIVIATCYKSGTTLVQQIVNLLINGEREFPSMAQISPWVDSGLHYPGAATVEALASPRFLKSHLPVEALPDQPTWRYIYIVRDGRDVCLSLYQHCKHLQAQMPTDAAGRPLDYGADDFPSFWRDWLATGRPRWPWREHVASWWRVRDRPNVLLLHYVELIERKREAAGRIAEFLELPWTDAIAELVCRGSALEHMQALEREGRFAGRARKARATFVNRGTNGRWRELLSEDQSERYLAWVAERLEPACARWVETGVRPQELER